MENNNRTTYAIIIVVSLILVYLTKQWLDSRKALKVDPIVPKQEQPFDPETYVDPYGITRCYPSDRKRLQKEREDKAKKKSATSKGKYHYHVNVSNVHRDRETYDREILADGSVRLKKKSTDLSHINGTYDWDMDLYITDDDELLSYIINNYDWLKKYKVSGSESNIHDDYNNRIDDYLDDPEDETTFDPDIFNFLDD